MKKLLLYICLFPAILWSQNSRQVLNFNSNWQFKNQEDFKSTESTPDRTDFSFAEWETITLPHTAKVEQLVVTEPWVGVSWYKKEFNANASWKGKKVSIQFEAVMQQADVWLNGKKLITHYGGYLPFSIDISNELSYDKTNRIVVKADNADNPEVPPGKPIKTLDFCYFSGIYRNVSLIVTQPLHITDAVTENLVASGGIRVWYSNVSTKSASIVVKTHVRNENTTSQHFQLIYKLVNKAGKTVLTSHSKNQNLKAGQGTAVVQTMTLANPSLWHPNRPNLYRLIVDIQQNNQLIDEQQINMGIRKFELKNEQLFINDQPLLLVGTNRHQEYPYIGNALSDNAQYRDAVKIKEAGFNIVRLSHYPQSPAFMDACDELGILTIAAIPGWQFVGNETFCKRSYQDARELIRRDRNHASVVFWELSLNESPMKNDFMQQMTSIAAEESPESKLLTCGWINKFYDVWIPARQHAKYPDYWKKYNGKTPLFTGEYGDWEYFAQDAGLNQAGYAGLKSDERTSRQLRADGEKRLLQQATNFQEAHNDNLRRPHLGDANWLMFDYNRGYSPDIESSGIMDIFRLPKAAYFFYQSQSEQPMLNIASFWNEKSDVSNLKVYSNCDEVALYLNNKLVKRKKADRDNNSDQLTHPPFVFHIPQFVPGELKAIGYTKNKEVAQDIVKTAGKPTTLILTYDKSGKALKADGADVVFVRAFICDKDGNWVTEASTSITFNVTQNGKLIGQNPIAAEAGIATILLQSNSFEKAEITITANAEGLKTAVQQIIIE